MMKKKILEAFSVGDRVVEKIARIRKKRIGEIVFIQEQRRRKLEMMQLNPHDLTPLRKYNMELFNTNNRYRPTYTNKGNSDKLSIVSTITIR